MQPYGTREKCDRLRKSLTALLPPCRQSAETGEHEADRNPQKNTTEQRHATPAENQPAGGGRRNLQKSTWANQKTTELDRARTTGASHLRKSGEKKRAKKKTATKNPSREDLKGLVHGEIEADGSESTAILNHTRTRTRAHTPAWAAGRRGGELRERAGARRSPPLTRRARRAPCTRAPARR